MNTQQMKIVQQNANKNANIEVLIEEYKYMIEQETAKIVIIFSRQYFKMVRWIPYRKRLIVTSVK